MSGSDIIECPMYISKGRSSHLSNDAIASQQQSDNSDKINISPKDVTSSFVEIKPNLNVDTSYKYQQHVKQKEVLLTPHYMKLVAEEMVKANKFTEDVMDIMLSLQHEVVENRLMESKNVENKICKSINLN